jgi:apolipoprotein D and lipocalin family protein
MRSNILSMVAVGLLAACVTNDRSEPPVQTVLQVDLKRYAGTWYEIAAFPLFFQRQCIGNTQANYTIESEDRIGVHNQCLTKDGIDKVDGIAEAVAGASNARLRVSFFRPFWADYWVIGLDSEYRWAVVGNPNRRNLWILSRTPRLPQEQLDAALAAARKEGFDLALLHYTAQAPLLPH